MIRQPTNTTETSRIRNNHSKKFMASVSELVVGQFRGLVSDDL